MSKMFATILKRSLHSMKQLQNSCTRKYCTTMSSIKYNTLEISVPKEFVYMVQLNRPEKLNALNDMMWKEIKECFDNLSTDPDCRVIVFSGNGRTFCAGMDFKSFMKVSEALANHDNIMQKAKILNLIIRKFQDTFLSIEKCKKPVIAAINGPCIGAGFNMVCATDIRYSTTDAWFQIKEIDLGMAADVGILQWLPKIIGSDSLVKELAYTGRKFLATEALQHGFTNQVFDGKESLLAKSIEIAEIIARKSPAAVQIIKSSLLYSRDHSTQEGLDHIAMYNQMMLQSEDFMNGLMSLISKGDPPIFSKL